MLHSMSLTTHTQIFVAVFLYFFPRCEQFFLKNSPVVVCLLYSFLGFLYSYFLESPLFCFYCLFSSFLFTIFLIAWFGLKASLYYQPFSVISAISVHYPSPHSSRLLKDSNNPFEHVHNERIGLSPTITKKICLVLVLVPFYPLSSTLYPLSPACF